MRRDIKPLIAQDTTGWERRARDLLENKVNDSSPNAQIIVPVPNIIGVNYIQVPEIGLVVAKRQDYNNLKWSDALKAVQDQGLRMLRMDEFKWHYLNLREAVAGKRVLFDGNGNQIDRREAEEHWNYVSSTNRSQFSNQSFWTWLDAFFKKDGNGKLYMETDHRIAKNGQVSSRNVRLDPYLMSDGWADLNTLNRQGLPTNAFGGNYSQGKNIYFWQPVENRVAGFGAGSGRADLNCGGYPSVRYPQLGVLACAEGTAAKI